MMQYARGHHQLTSCEVKAVLPTVVMIFPKKIENRKSTTKTFLK